MLFRSRANVYRRDNDIPYSWGTAVNVQMMAFGNMGETSGTGVAFTKDPATGEKKRSWLLVISLGLVVIPLTNLYPQELRVVMVTKGSISLKSEFDRIRSRSSSRAARVKVNKRKRGFVLGESSNKALHLQSKECVWWASRMCA